jgi:hypothetical protein
MAALQMAAHAARMSQLDERMAACEERLQSGAAAGPSGQQGGDPCSVPRSLAQQVVVRLPASGDRTALMSKARAAVRAAGWCSEVCLEGEQVLSMGDWQPAGAAADAAANAGPGEQRRPRTAVVMVYLRHAQAAQDAVRHSWRLHGDHTFAGVYLSEALSREQRRIRGLYWSSPELQAVRQRSGEGRRIQWREEVPFVREAQLGGASGRAVWRALAVDQSSWGSAGGEGRW